MLCAECCLYSRLHLMQVKWRPRPRPDCTVNSLLLSSQAVLVQLIMAYPLKWSCRAQKECQRCCCTTPNEVFLSKIARTLLYVHCCSHIHRDRQGRDISVCCGDLSDWMTTASKRCWLGIIIIVPSPSMTTLTGTSRPDPSIHLTMMMKGPWLVTDRSPFPVHWKKTSVTWQMIYNVTIGRPSRDASLLITSFLAALALTLKCTTEIEHRSKSEYRLLVLLFCSVHKRLGIGQIDISGSDWSEEWLDCVWVAIHLIDWVGNMGRWWFILGARNMWTLLLSPLGR